MREMMEVKRKKHPTRKKKRKGNAYDYVNKVHALWHLECAYLRFRAGPQSKVLVREK